MKLPDDIGLRVGLEIHRQLDTHKLFCPCRGELTNTTSTTFFRYLRPTRSELGSLDRAALHEAMLGRRFNYRMDRGVCLVEMDEEPPHDPNPEAIDITLTIARLMKAVPVDELSFMRKIVIDGSNTAGFQRTGLLASDGRIGTSSGDVGIDTICIEEDAARIVSSDHREATYRLDRLGIPEVEIATAPDIHTPEQAMEAAATIGDMLRSTGRVRRGVGTIRQDVNVSIRGGTRVEIKLVQELRSIPRIIETEARRQGRLIEAARLLRQRGLSREKVLTARERVRNLTRLLEDTDSKILGKALSGGGVILGVRLEGFGGTMGEPAGDGPRDMQWSHDGARVLGPEFAEHARQMGLKGLFHSDELPAYGMNADEVEKVYHELDCGPRDGFILVAGDEQMASEAMDAVIRRAAMAVDGVVGEVRRPMPDGSTRFMRPMPGAARMYPETDTRPVPITRALVELIDSTLPELFPDKIGRFIREHGLSREAAYQIVHSPERELYEKLAAVHDPRVSATMLRSTLAELNASGHDTSLATYIVLDEVLDGLEAAMYSKEALPGLIGSMCDELGKEKKSLPEDGPGVRERVRALRSDLVSRLGLGSVPEAEIREVIEHVTTRKMELITENGKRAVGPLMGPIMKELRGKADGKLISQLLMERIESIIADRR